MREPPRVRDDDDRTATEAAIQDAVRTHDDQGVECIRQARPWESWRGIARRLNLAGPVPPGAKYAHRAGEHPGRSWSHVAVRRIAIRHGIE